MSRAATLAAAAAVAAVLLLLCGYDRRGRQHRQREAAASAGAGPVLSFDFYKCSCPKAESIVRSFVQDAVRRDVGLAAGLLRLHFHDCFVQGCDASVLLDGSATGPGEQQAPPNLTLRPTAFKAINDIHDRLQKECGGAVVSCSDVLALAARDSVQGHRPAEGAGPDVFDNKYYVNLVNREGLFTSDQDLFSNPGTRPLVEKFARSQRDFFDQFAFSVVKMGQINLLTGAQGEIRTNCSARNADAGVMPWSVVEEAAESLVF